ncbi:MULTISPECIES: cbb3-type cytochrome oxidase assembly protein CcoS [Mesorhizobium]|uniref:Cbb3-type cytochrome oxidase assembly protein CcoS n=1 Tax=Mesorhizobium denitrificans TaxID=2294114 RepID=A0A371XGB6_9HYPH|nr:MULTISPECIES: cbb3-type cytochrome oxidase assembly protein CcoS [Mesorhizobium]RFC68275.1 cbb3-type cytochrome oxidase assembly protein CcoS [Mesorhizobium denitrificans]
MTNLIFLIPAALFLGGMSLIGFLWALRSGQYEDLDGASQRILMDDEKEEEAARAAKMR